MAGSNKLTVVMRTTCDDRCNVARLHIQLLILFTLSPDSGVDASFVISPRGYLTSFICARGWIKEISLCKSYLHQPVNAARVTSVSAMSCQVAAFCSRAVKSTRVCINSVAK